MTAVVEFMAGAEGVLLVIVINCISLLVLSFLESRP